MGSLKKHSKPYISLSFSFKQTLKQKARESLKKHSNPYIFPYHFPLNEPLNKKAMESLKKHSKPFISLSFPFKQTLKKRLGNPLKSI